MNTPNVNHPNMGVQPSPVAFGATRKKVIILAMGSSRNDFDAMQMMEHEPELLQGSELWGINYMGAVKRLDRIIHVDPVHAYLGHAPVRKMCDNALKDGIPIYTSWPHPFYINHVVYPFDLVHKSLGIHYFNNSVAYALALAIAEGYTDIGLFGADFSYPNMHMAESGRACCEFLIGMGTQRGIRFAIAANSTLLDLYCQQQPYGFFADPLVPPSLPGGRLMTVQEIFAHCQKMREGAKVVKPQIFAYTMQPDMPKTVEPLTQIHTEHQYIPPIGAAKPPLADGSMSQDQALQAGLAVTVAPPITGAPTHEAGNV